MQISKLAQNIPPSETLAIDAAAKELRGKGFNVVNFSAGEPDFRTPSGIRALTEGAAKHDANTKYSPAAGTMELRGLIAEKLESDNSLVYASSEVIVSNGAKQSLYNAVLAILNPGDEAMIIAPYWVTYPQQVKLVGAVPVFIGTDENFMPSVAGLDEKLTERTRLLIVNSPSNPTGVVYPEALLREIAQWAVKRNVMVISDEIYEKIVYGETHVSIASFNDEIKALTVTVNGLSKSHAMTGYRIGYAAGPKEIVAAMVRIQSQTTSGASSISQYSALGAFTEQGANTEHSRAIFEGRRDLVVAQLSSIEGISLAVPQGAFYAFPNISEAYRNSQLFDVTSGASVSESFAKMLLENVHVAVVPGKAFGADDHIRISYAVSEEEINEGIERIKSVLR